MKNSSYSESQQESRTRQRTFPEDTSWSKYLYKHPLLTSWKISLYHTDIDGCFWRYRAGVMFLVEKKIYGGMLRPEQEECLKILDAALRMADGKKFWTMRGERKVRFAGVFTLHFSGTCPSNSAEIRFARVGCKPLPITEGELLRIVGGGTGDPIDPGVWYDERSVGSDNEQ
ncbi:MAG: hypothetical protein IH851_09045 [Armatimonadetes bacterium]|nr:hypothetical protein [Armatimonadota bacterium]